MKGGFSQIIKTIQNELGDNLQLSSEIKKIVKDVNGVRLTIRKNNVDTDQFFNKTYLTLPSYACADLVKDIDPRIANTLSQIKYPRVWQIYCEVETAERTFDGFGFLIPASERLSLLGAICISNIFPDKAPHGKKLFALFCGGDRPYSFEPKVEEAIKEFHSIIRPSSIKVLHVQEWTQAIPQYYVGHKKILQSIKDFESTYSAIAFTGNYVSGVSLGDCVEYCSGK
jgi:oxygen-dependent protoporphyrinogen oxidase